MNEKLRIFILVFFICIVFGYSKSINLKTNDLDECIGITSFVSNNTGKFFLFSMRTHKIFKFKNNGDFIKSFCRYGIGPGEIKRVIFMFHNPCNDFLYLPESSSGLGRISIFDSQGNFKDYLDVELSTKQKQNITQLIFLEDGSFYAKISLREDWEPKGKIYLTKDKISVLYFNKKGNLNSSIFQTFQNVEVADKPRMGGPRILFLPNIVVNKTQNENICIGKSDENVLHIYDKNGKMLNSIDLEIQKKTLCDEEFNKAKSELVNAFKEGSRMQWLAKHMIQLKYKPLYEKLFIHQNYFILVDIKRDRFIGYPEKSTLMFFNQKGKFKFSREIKGDVMNIADNNLYIVQYDQDDNEAFTIEKLDL